MAHAVVDPEELCCQVYILHIFFYDAYFWDFLTVTSKSVAVGLIGLLGSIVVTVGSPLCRIHRR
jgi:ACR3 family arsenite efflux pump ArsB